MSRRKMMCFATMLAALAVIVYLVFTRYNLNAKIERGTIVDSLNGVYVYYNGGVNQSSGRNRTADGYNLGVKYQCVEFVKRYYYEYYRHKMPDAMGHAKYFFNRKLPNGAMNEQRGLIQYRNGAGEKPQVGDLIVFKAYIFNPYGHVAIVANVSDNEIEIIQQNYGFWGAPRKKIPLSGNGGKWTILDKRILGWLRKETYDY